MLLWWCCFSSVDPWSWSYCSLQLLFFFFLYTESGSWWSLLCVANSIMIELEFYYCLIKFKAPIVFDWLLGSSTFCCQISDWVFEQKRLVFWPDNKEQFSWRGRHRLQSYLIYPPQKKKKKERRRHPHSNSPSLNYWVFVWLKLISSTFRFYVQLFKILLFFKYKYAHYPQKVFQ